MYDSANLNLPLQVPKAGLFLLHRGFIIDIHGGRNIGVPHDFLDDFQVGFVLTEAGAEGVPQIMDGEVREQDRLPPLLFSGSSFLSIAVTDDVLDDLVDRCTRVEITFLRLEDKAKCSRLLHFE